MGWNGDGAAILIMVVVCWCAGRRRTGKLREQVTFDLKSGGRLAGG